MLHHKNSARALRARNPFLGIQNRATPAEQLKIVGQLDYLVEKTQCLEFAYSRKLEARWTIKDHCSPSLLAASRPSERTDKRLSLICRVIWPVLKLAFSMEHNCCHIKGTP